jgi:hypothetical protein
MTGLALVLAAVACIWPPALVAAVAALAGPAWLNRPFYGFLARARGRWFAIRAFPLHLVYFVCCGLSVAVALAMVPWLGRGEAAVPRGRIDAGRSGAGRWPRAVRRDRRGSPRR